MNSELDCHMHKRTTCHKTLKVMNEGLSELVMRRGCLSENHVGRAVVRSHINLGAITYGRLQLISLRLVDTVRASLSFTLYAKIDDHSFLKSHASGLLSRPSPNY